MYKKIKKELNSYSNSDKIEDFKRFFKTKKGEYGYGDKFLGIKVPNNRKVIKKYYKEISFDDTQKFISSPFHEERLFGFLTLVYKYKTKTISNDEKEYIYSLFLNNIEHLNNWDLIDTTVPHVMGNYLLNQDKALLYDFAKSDNLWERRISIIATFEFIKNNSFQDTLDIADILINDKEDLIQKAVGWMLREVGKKDFEVLESFLNPRYKNMPRTMLRYSIEKFDENLRQSYIKGTI
jgi:3-methyladenine DNA glycosylase AlkD